MACEHTAEIPSPGSSSRRSFLTGAGLLAAGLGSVGAVSGVTPASAAPASANQAAVASTWRADTESPRFTLVVLPDTQYLFDGDSLHPEPLQATMDRVLERRPDENIVALAHLGDITQNGQPAELASAGTAFRALDRRGLPYSVLAGNHDINSSTDDSRGSTPFLSAFGPSRFRGVPGYSASPDGYNTARVFRAGGRDWLMLAMDWRASATGIAWARGVIAAHPGSPVILTTHDLVYADADGGAELSDNGSALWNGLMLDHDQVFLGLGGHYWPPGRTVRQNRAGHDVHLHITNYQDRYYGGAAAIRLYRFDLERDTIDVETITPWWEKTDYSRLNELARQEIELTDDRDRFNVPIDFSERFAGFAPVPQRAARPVSAALVPGTVAYWRFDAAPSGGVVRDLSGHGNDLRVAGRPGARSDALSATADHHPDQPSHGSTFFRGGRVAGDYLATVDGAAINTATFRSGFTVEAFFKLPADWGPDNFWSALFSRRGSSGDAGKTGGYSTTEPVATLSLSGSVEPQWYVYPLNLNTSVTNWGHLLPLETWFHLAIVNDGRHTVLYVDGCEVVRNPSTIANGIATLGRSWLVGGHEDGGAIDQIHYGWLGDIRIADRPLPPSRFLIA